MKLAHHRSTTIEKEFQVIFLLSITNSSITLSNLN